jgi:hypothetical protein
MSAATSLSEGGVGARVRVVGGAVELRVGVALVVMLGTGSVPSPAQDVIAATTSAAVATLPASRVRAMMSDLRSPPCLVMSSNRRPATELARPSSEHRTTHVAF